MADNAKKSGESALKVSNLRPAPGAKTAKTRVGRGEGSKGKTAGRGTKGTSARYQVPERFEGGSMPMHMRLPKDRKSTRLNSSHSSISYAVFCLKKKTKNISL